VSTGGTTGKRPGRVGDSPLAGSGAYADNDVGAACATGWGEGIMRLVLAKWALDQLTTGVSAETAAYAAVQRLQDRLNGYGGIIVLDRDGGFSGASTNGGMPCGTRNEEGELVQEL
jgi:beta-aspartyl-peptidase (threonine type)